MKVVSLIVGLVLIPSFAFGAVEDKLMSLKSLKCADTSVVVETFTNEDLDNLDSRKVVVTATDRAGDKAVLTFVSGSFGAECRNNSLNWRGFLVFQTACPARPSPTEPADKCDYTNNFGIINGSEVLLVPRGRNGKLAAEIFENPGKSRSAKMRPVKAEFNVHKGR